MQALLWAVLICDVGGPGTTTQAQPVVDKFLGHLARSGGWRPRALAGSYQNDPAECEAYYRAHKPALVALDLATYLAKRRSWRLRPLAQLRGSQARRYYLLVRKGSFGRPSALAGKKLVTTLARDPRFLYRVVLGGKVPAGHFTLVQSRRPLKGLREVAQGRAAATLVDEAAYAYLAELRLPHELESIFSSRPLPGLTLALSAHGSSDKNLARQVAKALPRLCEGAGAELCKTFAVQGFVPAKTRAYRALERQYR